MRYAPQSTPQLLNLSTVLPSSSFDFLIVGAGFAGTVLAEHIATQLGKTCLVIDRRNRTAGLRSRKEGRWRDGVSALKCIIKYNLT